MDSIHNRVARRRRKGQAGFTLIELLVVIAILSVLAAIVIINVTGVKGNAQSSACKSDTEVGADGSRRLLRRNSCTRLLPAGNSAAPVGPGRSTSPS